MWKGLISGIVILFGITSAYATCGSHGGPGYRGPNGRCVSWVQIGRTCGYPPTARCKPEAAARGAAYAAKLGSKIEALRSSYLPNGGDAYLPAVSGENVQLMTGPSWPTMATLLGATAFFAFGLGVLAHRRATAKKHKLEAQRLREHRSE